LSGVSLHPLAGKPAPRSLLVDVPELVSDYYTLVPDPAEPSQQVAFGTSGHRGSSLRHAFNESHILAITQAICDYRRERGIDGPLYLGRDTHALSDPALRTALEVLAENDVAVRFDPEAYTPTPAVSHAILSQNRGKSSGLADGIVITPSHNPPEDGGIKYNAPHGGPAGNDATSAIEREANRHLRERCRNVRRRPYERARRASGVQRFDYVAPYVADLASVVDLEPARGAGLRIGVDPMGGANVGFWGAIAERYGLDLEVVNQFVDPTFSFLRVDRDGKLRMDCSSPWAMAGLVELKDRFDIAFGNDADSDRHGIVTRRAGLLDPNHYLAVAVEWLFSRRFEWSRGVAIGKTLVTSSLLDRVARRLGRALVEVPVGFKWFVDGLFSGSLGFGGEESAGASFLRRNGSVWTTDKDGILLDLLAVEMTAAAGKDPGTLYLELTRELGSPVYERIDEPANAAQKAALKKLSPDDVVVSTLAGEPIVQKLTRAPGNGEPIGGLKVVTENGWFAARPSGTEDVYKIYTESFLGPDHLAQIQDQARNIVRDAFNRAGV
jgi:phosphoglucomutase